MSTNPRAIQNLFIPSLTYHRIEIFGLCGAGKTTVLAALEPYLNRAVENGYFTIARPCVPSAAASRTQTFLLMLELMLKNPFAMSKFILHGPRNRNLVKKLGYRWASMKMRPVDAPLLLVDSGVIQPLISFVIEDQNSDENLPFRSFMNLFISPVAVIYFHCQPETSFKRYVRREENDLQRPTRRNFGEVDLASRFKVGFELCQHVADEFKQHGTPVIVIDTENPVSPRKAEQIVAQLVECLDKLNETRQGLYR